MTSPVPASSTSNQNIDGLLAGISWKTLNLTYSFPSIASLYEAKYGSSEPETNFQSLNGAQRAAVRKVFGMISSVTEVNFSEIQESPYSKATLRLARSDALSPAWAYFPGEDEAAGDAWFRTSGAWLDNPLQGSYAFYVFLHELGHIIGLKHGHENSAYGALDFSVDSMEFSVMTYRSHIGAEGRYLTNEQWGFAQSLMMLDIAALQYLYGADFSTNAGNTTYRWDPATGQSFIDGVGQGVPGDNRIFMTVWDGGGNDTFDFSNYRTDLSVNLNPGQWSRVSDEQLSSLSFYHKARGNIANALLYEGDTRSLIENAIGGAGKDHITGNMAGNFLKGRGGADRLYGNGGDDILCGGTGKDILAGGPGRDAFLFDARPKSAKNQDRIIDFVPVDDVIHLENSVFKKIGPSGKLAGKAFHKGSEAHDYTDRIIYNSKSGALYYDSDGLGDAAQVRFAQVSKGLKITAADFFMV